MSQIAPLDLRLTAGVIAKLQIAVKVLEKFAEFENFATDNDSTPPFTPFSTFRTSYVSTKLAIEMRLRD